MVRFIFTSEQNVSPMTNGKTYYYIFKKNSIHVPGTTICIYASKNAYVLDHALYSFIIFVHLSYYLYFVYRILLMSVPIDGCTRS